MRIVSQSFIITCIIRNNQQFKGFKKVISSNIQKKKKQYIVTGIKKNRSN